MLIIHPLRNSIHRFFLFLLFSGSFFSHGQNGNRPLASTQQKFAVGDMFFTSMLLTGKSDNYNYNGDGAFRIGADNAITGHINWVMKLKEDPGLFTLKRNNIPFSETVEGYYDLAANMLFIKGIDKDNNGDITDNFEISLLEDNRIAGNDKSELREGIRNGTITGNYKLSKKASSVVLRPGTDGRIPGCWTVVVSSGSTALPGVVRNQILQFNHDGTGISRNEHGNTLQNASIFNWYVVKDTLHLGDLACQFVIANNFLTTKPGKAGNGKSTSSFSLKKIFANPLENYQPYFSDELAKGNWLVAGMVKNGRLRHYLAENLRDGQNTFYDIHPFTETNGELVVYRFPGVEENLPFDSLIFISYDMQEKNNADNQEGDLFSLNGMSVQLQADFHCRFSDGIGVLQGDSMTLYLIKTGAPNWNNLAALHQSYNAHYFRNILPPPHAHWVKCAACYGSGKVDNSYYDMERNRRIEREKDCLECFGHGGYYVDDITGERQTSFSLFDLF